MPTRALCKYTPESPPAPLPEAEPEPTMARSAPAACGARTVDAILDATLALLDRDGERRTTTNRIAAAAGISPGNLYYHFRHREAIVLALFDRLVQALAARRAGIDRHPAAAAFAADFGALVQTVQARPGLFRALPELLGQDAELAGRSHDWAAAEQGRLIRHFAALAAAGLGTPPLALQAPLAAAVWHLLLARAWRGAEANEPLPSAILLAPLAAWLDAPTLARLGAGIGDAAYQSPQSSSSSPSDSS